MNEPLYRPSPMQAELHACKANEICLGGAAGPGKSLGVLMDPIQTQLLYEHPRWERGDVARSVGWAIHFRKEFPRLEQTIERSKRIFPVIDPGVHWDSAAHCWTFSCGYKFQFGHIHNADDRFNYASNEYTHIGWDELWENEYEVYQFINTRLRSSDPELQKRLRIVSGTNPAGNWVRDYFVEPCREGRKLLTKKILLDDGTEALRTRIFLPCTLKDNPDAGFRRQYEIELQDKPAHIRRALLYGDWWVVPGAFFADEFRDMHIVEPFRIPAGWTRFRSMDWGYKAPGCVLYFAVDPDENLVCYREVNFQRLDVDQVADKLQDIEMAADEWDEKGRCSKLTGPADTQIWSEQGTIGPTIEETMSLRGVFWEKCTKNRRASVQQLLRRLRDTTGFKKVPGIRFFSTCKRTIGSIPTIGTDKTDPELPEDGGDDHWLDAVLYACMYRMSAGKEEAKRPFRDELEQARERRLRRQQRGRFGYGGF